MILHIIGLILKIIGILLLVILGILLLVIGVLLFVPLRYELRAGFPGKLEEAEGSLKISWLLHLIAGRVEYRNGDVKWQGRIAWKKLGDDLEAEDKPVKKAEKKPDGGKKAGAKNAGKRTAARYDEADVRKPQAPPEKETESGTDAKSGHAEAKIEKPQVNAEELPDEKPKTEAQESPDMKAKTFSGKKEENATPEKDSEFREKKDVHDERESRKTQKTPRKRKKPVRAFGKLLRKISRKLREILEKIKCTWKNLCDKIKNIADKKDKILEFMEKENHKAAFERGKKELVWVKRFLKPKKLRIKLHYGFEDPYHTGQVLALCGMLYAFIGENMDLEPDFEKRVLDGNIYVKGRLRAVHMAVFAAKLLLDKDIRSTYHDIRAFKW